MKRTTVFSGKKFVMLSALIFFVISADAQTTIEVMAMQPQEFKVYITDEPVTVTDSTVIFGENIEISGGEEPYYYTWLKDNQPAGNEPTLEVRTYIRSDLYSLSVSDANNCKAVVTMPGDFEIPQNIENEVNVSKILVYPIPATEYLIIDPAEYAGEFEVTIYTTEGTLLLKRNIAGVTSIDIDLSTGLYLMRIESTDKRFAEVKKIVVL